MLGYGRAARRLLRDRHAVAGLLVLVTLAALAAETSASASVVLSSDIDANWRGAYDILVRPTGARLALESTDGLVEPNFLSFAGGGGLGPDDVAAIRAIPGVDVAAPVSVVGYLSYAPSTPLLCIPELPAEPSLFELSYDVKVDDGTRSLLIQHRSGRVFVGPEEVPLNHFRDWYSSLGDVSAEAGPTGPVEGDMFLGYLPAISSPLIAVDPSAESALLGANGSFLKPLARLEGRGSLTTSTFDVRLIPTELSIARGDLTGSPVDRPVVPIVVSREIYANLTLHLDVSRIGRPLPDYPQFINRTLSEKRKSVEAAVGDGVTRIGAVDLDLAGRIRPYLPPPAVLVWPNERPTRGQCLNQTEVRTPRLDSLLLVGRPAYTALASGGGTRSFVASALGYVSAAGAWAAPQPAPDPSAPAEQAYRATSVRPLAAAESFTSSGPDDQPFRFAPVGLFDPSAVDAGFNPLSYVPIGAYVPPRTLIERDDAVPSASGAALRPGLNPAGFITVPPLAVTDLDAARLLRGPRSVDAVRVRVSGVSRYNLAGRQQVSRVAAALVGLGYDVDVVAGASPEPVAIRLPRYHSELPSVPDLEAVSQEWTTLGAATRVSTALGSVNTTLAGLSIVTGLGFAIALEVGRAARRQRDFLVLSTTGWSRGDILRWYSSEAQVAGAIVALVGLGWWSAGPRTIAGLVVVLALAICQPVLAGFALVGLARGRRRAAPASAGVVTAPLRFLPGSGASPVGYGVRTVVSRPISSTIMIGSCSVGLASLLVSLVSVATASASAGPTLLAEAESARLSSYQLLQLSTIAAANSLLFLSLWVGDWKHRSFELRVLIAAGWSDRQVGLAVLSGGVVLAALAAPPTGALTMVLLDAIGWHASPAAVVAGALATLAILVVASATLVRRTASSGLT
jgi:hypothetical protein